MPLQAVLFDHDGTLVDSEAVHLDVWNEVLAEFGVAIDTDSYQRHYAGVPTDVNARDLVRLHRLPIDPVALAARKVAVTEQGLQRAPFPLMPQALDVLQRLADAGLRMAVVTGANGFGVLSTLRGHALEHRFEAWVSRDDVRHSKPAPDCYLLALQRLGLSADQCIAVEDTGPGLTAAVGAGLRCLAIPTELSATHDFSKASAVLPDLQAAADWLLAARSC